jgi:hypothetical protein
MSTRTALLNPTIISTKMKVSFTSNTTTTRRNWSKILKASQARPPSTSSHKRHKWSMTTAKISLSINTLALAVEVAAPDKPPNTN